MPHANWRIPFTAIRRLRRAPRAGEDEAALELRGVSACYGATLALDGIDLVVEPGEIVALLGANGAGKTTTLKTIVGLVRANGGSIHFAGEKISSLPTESIVARGISLTPEGREVFGTLTVAENLRIGGALKGQSSYARRLEEALDLFPVLRAKMSVFAGLLSGGEQQQLAIARSLMSEPRLLLLDEPSLGLAPLIVDRVFELIVHLRERGTTLLLAEQNVEKALQIADRAYVLSAGRVKLEGPVGEVRGNPEVEDAYLGIGVPGN